MEWIRTFWQWIRKKKEDIKVGLLVGLLLLVLSVAVPPLGRLMLRVLSLGTDFLADLSVRSAALDPTPSSAATLTLIIPSLYLALTFGPFLTQRQFVKEETARLKKVEEELDKLDRDLAAVAAGAQLQPPVSVKEPSISERVAALRVNFHRDKRQLRRSKRLNRVLLSTVIPTFLFAWIGTLVLNQATNIWRRFHANLAICAPYLAPGQELQLRAKFAGMRESKDYTKIKLELEAIAAREKVRLK